MKRLDSGLAQMPKSPVDVFSYLGFTLLSSADIWKRAWQYGQ